MLLSSTALRGVKKLNVMIYFVVLALGMISVSKSEELTSSTWMKGESDDKQLSELTILGTHNACALYGGDYGACQSLELKAQLELGVRFLDIRCQWKEGDFHIVHGIADQKMRFSEVINICQNFLKENPSEMLLMSVMEQRSKNRKPGDFSKTFERLIKDGKEKEMWYQKKKLPTLGEGRGKIVVVSRNKELDGVPWSAFRIQDKFWINKSQSIDQKWQAIVKHFTTLQVSQKPSINFTSCTGIFNPPNFTASKLNPRLINYLKDKVKRPKRAFGIVVVDFVTTDLYQALYD